MSSGAPRSTMKLISLQDQNLDGSRHLKVDEEFEMSERSARFLIRTKRARPANAKVVVADPTRKDVSARD